MIHVHSSCQAAPAGGIKFFAIVAFSPAWTYSRDVTCRVAGYLVQSGKCGAFGRPAREANPYDFRLSVDADFKSPEARAAGIDELAEDAIKRFSASWGSSSPHPSNHVDWHGITDANGRRMVRHVEWASRTVIRGDLKEMLAYWHNNYCGESYSMLIPVSRSAVPMPGALVAALADARIRELRAQYEFDDFDLINRVTNRVRSNLAITRRELRAYTTTCGLQLAPTLREPRHTTVPPSLRHAADTVIDYLKAYKTEAAGRSLYDYLDDTRVVGDFVAHLQALINSITGESGLWKYFARLIGAPMEAEPFSQQAKFFEAAGIRAMACGHHDFPARVEDQAELYEDGHACLDCYDEGEVVFCVDTGRHQMRSSAYYSDDSDEWYTYDPDSDDNGSDPDRRLSYDTDVMRYLKIDPSFKSSSTGDFHMGIELETVNDSGNSINYCVRKVREELGRDYVVGKYDGSVGDEGIEWVTRPTSLKTHIAKLSAWSDSAKGLVAWRPGSCGMHIHIDSRAFTAMTLAKMVLFMNHKHNAAFIRGIAGRHPNTDDQARSYAGVDVPDADRLSAIQALKSKGSNSARRYVMVNTSNLGRKEAERLGLENPGGSSNTVEVRIFRASMNKARLLAQIEFTHALVMFCRFASNASSMPHEEFVAWLRKCGQQYHHLRRWLKINNSHGTPKQAKDSMTATQEAVSA